MGGKSCRCGGGGARKRKEGEKAGEETEGEVRSDKNVISHEEGGEAKEEGKRGALVKSRCS